MKPLITYVCMNRKKETTPYNFCFLNFFVAFFLFVFLV